MRADEHTYESSIEKELVKTYFSQPNNDERGQFFQTPM